MRIGIDISSIQYRGTGVSRYINELVQALHAQDNMHSYHLVYTSWKNALKDQDLYRNLHTFPTAHFHHIHLPEKIAHTLWNTWAVLHIERFTGPLDVYLYSDWFLMPTWARRFTTVHDLVFRQYPETVDAYVRTTQEKRLAYLAREQVGIFTDSHATKQDLEKFYPSTKGRIKVIYPGITVLTTTDDTMARVLKKFGLKRGAYIFTVGKNEPRKNYRRLLEAWAHIEHDGCELVIAGPEGWGVALPGTRDVRTIGLVSDEELYALYKGARGFAFVSLYEGFGFPVAEAMAVGTPVCVSNNSSLPEIVGEYGLYCEPKNVMSIAQGIKKLLQNTDENKKRAEKGKLSVQSFTWKVAAKAVLRSLTDDYRH